MQPQDRPRKRPSRAMRESIYQRSNGVCQRDGCGKPIEFDTFHVAHLRSHVHGGALVESNLEAWCSRCNLMQGAQDVRDTRTTPREWQLAALDTIVKRITDDGAATLSAAPGAGKTIFTGLVFEALHNADVIDRMVVLAPRRTLVEQWTGALFGARHIELKPGAELERPGQDGVVTTYQSLNAETLNVHRHAARAKRTLLVLDEVHHVGEREGRTRPAWARNVTELAGEVDVGLNVAGVLNLSGTLWRSRVDERISTVRYRALGDGRLEAEQDWNVPAEQIIREGELRPIDIRHVDGRVEIFDTAQFEMIDSNMADLDEAPARATLRELGAHHPWREAFVRSILDRLQEAHDALGGHHVKALIVAARQADARLFQNEVNEQMHARGLRPLAEIAVSDDPDAARTLEAFRRSDRVGVLCTVDMAGEGYDCPDIAVVGYASNKLTELYVRQVVARAMRVTAIERNRGRVIPAVVVVPDVPVLIEKLKEYLAPISHEITIGDDGADDLRERDDATEREPRLIDVAYHVQSVTPGAERVTVPLGDSDVTFTAEQLHAVADVLERYNLPTVLHARVLAAMGDIAAEQERRRPFDAGAVSTHDAFIRPVSIEESSSLTMGQIRELEKWWAVNGDVPIGVFAGRANAAAGIKSGGGRDSAPPERLKLVLEHEVAHIAAYCRQTGKAHPRGMRGVG